jgi:hypothetical protein
MPVLDGTLPCEHRTNLAAEFCPHYHNAVGRPGFPCPNPIPRPFDTDSDRDPNPELASPSTFSGSH